MPSKKISQKDITYAVVIGNSTDKAFTSVEAHVLVKNKPRFVELSAPSIFKIDDATLSFFWDPKNPDSKDCYVKWMKEADLKCGMHTFTFIDLNNTIYTDSFWYCQPKLEAQTLQWQNDSTISIKLSGVEKPDSIFFYLSATASINSTAGKAVPLKNGTATIELSKIDNNFRTMLKGDYQLFAYYTDSKKLQRGTLTIRSDTKYGLSLK